MKAKEYFEKYKDTIHTDGPIAELTPLFEEFHAETVTLLKSRHCASVSSIQAVLKEMHIKYTKTAELLNNYFGVEYVKVTGFLSLFKALHPEFKVSPFSDEHIVDRVLPSLRDAI